MTPTNQTQTTEYNSVEEIAARLKLSEKTIIRRIRAGKLKAIAAGENGGQPYRIREDWFREYEASLLLLPVPAAKPPLRTVPIKAGRRKKNGRPLPVSLSTIVPSVAR